MNYHKETRFNRTLKLQSALSDSSLLLLGPRQTGKSTLIRETFQKNALYLDLLNPELFRDLNKSPSLLKEMIFAQSQNTVIVDEIQKLPELLDVVHSCIEERKKLRFVLTGSSARKLKKEGQNMLGGRAYPLYLHPITSFEYSAAHSHPKLDSLLQWGGLPSVLNAESHSRKLKAYIGIYLQEEIKAEGYARSLVDFSNFLEVAALTNGEQIDFTGVARDVQLSPRTVSAYYSILQDTLIGYLLSPFTETQTRKAVSTPKFYFFDVGISNFLTGREQIAPGTPEFGKVMEHFVFTELIAYRDYQEKEYDLFFWRSTSQFEVDFLIRFKKLKKLIAIEVKASSRVDRDDLRGIRAFEDDFKIDKKILVCNEKQSRMHESGVLILPLSEFCSRLWANQLF